MIARAATYAATALVGAVLLTGCNLHREGALRSAIGENFHIGDTFYHESKMSCTVAVFRATQNEPKAHVLLETDILAAQRSFARDGLAALRMQGVSPAQLTDLMLAAQDDSFGSHALAAAAQASACLADPASRDFRMALERPSAMLAYDRTLDGVIVIDPVERKLFFAAGNLF